jgi:predicted nucleotidyltransferase
MLEQLAALLQALQPYQPQRIILFGSVARGEADAESDLDVLVIKDTAEPFMRRLEHMAELCPPGVHADILVYTPAELWTEHHGGTGAAAVYCLTCLSL